MSAHLQFGPEWMRKGPGKTSTTPSNEGTIDLSAPSGGGTGSSPVPASNSKAAGASSAAPGGGGAGVRRNASNSGLAPAPVAATALPSPGGFSFAAAASGAATSPGTTGGGTAGSTSDRFFNDGSGGESSRYSKRLLSLYSTERGPSNKGTTPAAPEAMSAAANPPPTATAPATQTTFGRRKGFDARETNSRRSHSINTDIANAGAAGNSAASRPFPTAMADYRPDSQRPGLFQRGSAAVAFAGATSPSAVPAAVSPTILQQFRGSGERERHGSVGIQGGVLSGVASGNGKKSHRDGVNGAGDGQTRDEAGDAAGGGSGEMRLATKESMARMRRERLPGEGPIGPPTDHSGGFAKGFERRRERQASVKRYATSGDPTAAPVSSHIGAGDRSRQPNAISGHQSNPSLDIDLSHHAATVVEALNLDEEDESVLTTSMGGQQQQQQQQQRGFSQDSLWSPETAMWFYRDPSGQVQGPFKAAMMQTWFAANFFPEDLFVRRAEVEAYAPLGKVLQLIGDPINPFLVPPSQWAAQQQLSTPGLSASHPAALTWGSSPAMGAAHLQEFSSSGRQSPFLTNPALAGLGAGQSSPFATPPTPFAELDGTRNQEYLVMIRQRELAEQQQQQQQQQQQRALQEQRNAQMIAMAMAQQQQQQSGWIQGVTANGPYAGGAGSFGDDWSSQQPTQRQQYAPQHEPQQEQRAFDQIPADEYAKQQQPQPQASVWDERAPQVAAQEDPAAPVEEPHMSTHHSADKPASKTPSPVLQIDSFDASSHTEGEAATAQTAANEDETPEQLWPQSPSAVEFASEPALADDPNSSSSAPQQHEDMTVVKGNKKSRRAANAGSRTASASTPAQDAGAPADSLLSGPGGLSVVSEAQFRRGKSVGREAGNKQPGSSNWPTDEASISTPTSAKAAPWASSAAAGSGQEGLSLREIQEAEARRASQLKAAQQQAARANLTSSTSGGDLPMNMSWGLASVPSSVVVQQSAGGANSSSAAPVWNSTGARQTPTKKTLTEIQEEERKRAQKAATAAAAAAGAAMANAAGKGGGRGYADLVGKIGPPPMSGASSAGLSLSSASTDPTGWAVVGAGGKANSAASTPSAAAAVPSSLPAAPSLRVTSSATRGAAPMRTASSSGATTTSGGGQASASFVRYCKEQLKGLNVKVDDFIEMLLSFPLDPSPDVVEIIAESVYANSSTLDGRRFASDFVAKRKADATVQRAAASGAGDWSVATNGAGGKAAARSARGGAGSEQIGTGLNGSHSASSLGLGGGTSAGSEPGTRSASEVLRAPPARQSNDFGGFKVVKAKGAKKRT